MTTIRDIKTHNKQASRFFFEPATLRFFSSRISSVVHEGPGGIFFVTSEQFDWQSPRLYTIRKYDPATGEIDSASEFQEFANISTAQRNAAKLAQGK